jgi:hypothetical protein
MLTGLALWIKILGTSNGTILLVWILQFVLYSEATNVVTGLPSLVQNTLLIQPWNGWKWWWFVAYSLAANGRHVLEHFASQAWLPTLNLVSLGMALLGFVSFVLNLNGMGNDAVSFRRALSELATQHLALVRNEYDKVRITLVDLLGTL